MNVEIDRVRIALHGITAMVVESAAEGLDAEIRRRLGAAGSPGRQAPLDITGLSAGSIRSGGALDAGTLRGVIAERLVQAIREQLSEPSDVGLE